MTAAANAPRLIRGGIVLVDSQSGQVLRVIAMQYNPDTLTRTLQPQAVTGDGQDRSLALRLKGPPIETIKLDAEIDATDDLEHPDAHPEATRLGIAPQLAVLETLLYPPSARLVSNNSLQAVGVRIADFSITEEAFDARLNPLRAKVSLSMRVLSVDDLGFDTKGGALYLMYQQAKERLAQGAPGGALPTLGLTGI